jgi:hypothetical protein
MKEGILRLDSRNRRRINNCPCGKSNKDGKFVPYIGYVKFGFCHSCGENFLPNKTENWASRAWRPKLNEPIEYIPKKLFDESFSLPGESNFTYCLKNLFGNENVKHLINEYKIGQSDAWPGATVFWYIDAENKIRDGKIMLYCKQTLNRIKEPRNYITWVHTKERLLNTSIESVLFGEHLLEKYPEKRIAIVESEKSAVVASLFFPDFIWLATGGLGNLSAYKLKGLRRRYITLFPDLGAYGNWLQKTKQFDKSFKIHVDDFLERNANALERSNKYDLADYLLKFNLKDFKK